MSITGCAYSERTAKQIKALCMQISEMYPDNEDLQDAIGIIFVECEHIITQCETGWY